MCTPSSSAAPSPGSLRFPTDCAPPTHKEGCSTQPFLMGGQSQPPARSPRSAAHHPNEPSQAPGNAVDRVCTPAVLARVLERKASQHRIVGRPSTSRSACTRRFGTCAHQPVGQAVQRLTVEQIDAFHRIKRWQYLPGLGPGRVGTSGELLHQRVDLNVGLPPQITKRQIRSSTGVGISPRGVVTGKLGQAGTQRPVLQQSLRRVGRHGADIRRFRRGNLGCTQQPCPKRHCKDPTHAHRRRAIALTRVGARPNADRKITTHVRSTRPTPTRLSGQFETISDCTQHRSGTFDTPFTPGVPLAFEPDAITFETHTIVVNPRIDTGISCNHLPLIGLKLKQQPIKHRWPDIGDRGQAAQAKPPLNSGAQEV